MSSLDDEPKQPSLMMPYVEEDTQLGNGTYKTAFTLKLVTPGNVYNFILQNKNDITKFCLVKFRDVIRWNPNNTKMYKEQYQCIAELNNLFKLSKKMFAPKLHQIRIDIVSDDGTIQQYGIPFLPEKMNANFKIINSDYVKITYVIEKCDESIIKFLLKNTDKIEDVGQKVVELIDAYVKSENELISDIKPENFCPKINDDGTFENVRFLDVDTRYIIKGIGQEFNYNAGVFMKYAFLVYSKRWGEIIDGKKIRCDFENLGITQDDFDNMIRFFYQEEYMKNNEFNPVNMLYHYFINLHPYKVYNSKYKEGYSFLNYAALMKYFNINEILKIFHDANSTYKIVLPARTGKTGGGSKEDEAKDSKDDKTESGKEDSKDDKTESGKEDSKDDKTESGKEGSKEDPDSKGGKNPRKRRKSKSKKRGRKVRTRKN